MGDRALQCLAPAWLQPCAYPTMLARALALTQMSIALPLLLAAAVRVHGCYPVYQS